MEYKCELTALQNIRIPKKLKPTNDKILTIWTKKIEFGNKYTDQTCYSKQSGFIQKE